MEEYLNGLDYENVVEVLEWNKQGRKWGKRRIDDIDKIIIHQSLSDGKLESINNYLISPGNHISPKSGCPHICYHIVIKKDGNIILCNSFDDITWHTKGQNANGLSICVLGNFNGVGWNKGHEPTDEQMISLELLIEQLVNNLNLNVKNIYGHYHFGKPACPGKTITELIENIRNNKPIDKIEMKPIFVLNTVKDIQNALLSLGFNLPKFGADGIMGEETKAAIVAFQIKRSIAISGVADENTRNEIIKLMSERGI